MATIYIETSVVSYLTAQPSSQVVALSRQMLTKRWWDEGRLEHELFTSQFVIDEATQGDSECSEKRLAVLAEIPLLDVLPEIFNLADDLLAQAIIPAKARLDALHISIAAVHSLEYLLTWNCKHIANAHSLPAIYLSLGRKTRLCCPFDMYN